MEDEVRRVMGKSTRLVGTLAFTLGQVGTTEWIGTEEGQDLIVP